MFSFKKPLFTRRVRWIRGRVASRLRHSVDLEAAPSPSTGSSVGRTGLNESSNFSSPKTNPKEKAEQNTLHKSGMGGHLNEHSDGSKESRSEPVLGPHSNPNDFVLASSSGLAIPKATSALAIVNGESPDQPVWIHESDAGLRRRVNRDGFHSTQHDSMQMVQLGDIAFQGGGHSVAPRPRYLHGYLDLMCITGTSRRLPVDWRDKKDWLDWIKTTFSLLLFCVVILGSCWDSSNESRLRFLYFMDGHGLSYFVDFCFHMSCLVTQTYSAFRFTLKIQEIDTMLNNIDDYEREYDSQADCHCSHWKWIIIGICCGTLIVSAAETVFEYGFEDWSLELLGRYRSHEFSEHVFLWSHKNVSNRSYELSKEYGRPENYKVGYAFMSAIGCMSKNFKMGTLRDLILVGVFVIFLIVFGLMRGIKETMENAPKGNIAACRALQQRREKLYKQYRKVRFLIDGFNLVFDTILLLIHVNNLLLYGYFACLWIEQDENDSVIIYIDYAFSIIKAELIYFLGKRIFVANLVMDKWFRKWSDNTGKIIVDGEEYDVHVLFRELDKEPMGIGTGIFQISQEFHLKYLAMVLSFIFFIADERKNRVD